MLGHAIGKKNFKKGLRKLVKKHKFGNFDQDDLWEAMSEFNEGSALPEGRTLKEVMDPWALQPFNPLITVKRKGDVIECRQEVYEGVFNQLPKNVGKRKQRWWIPITYTKPGGDFFDKSMSPTAWLSPKENVTHLTVDDVDPDEALIVNVNSMGLFRVNYEEENWSKISAALRKDHKSISVGTRAQLVDEALSLAKSGIVEYRTAFEVTSYLNKERECVPWLVFIDHMESLIVAMQKTGRDTKNLEVYIVRKLLPLFRYLGVKARPGESHQVTTLREAFLNFLLTYIGDDRRRVKEPLNMFSKWYKTRKKETFNSKKSYEYFPAHVREGAYCAAVKSGTAKTWNLLFKTYNKIRKEAPERYSEREALLRGLGCYESKNKLRVQ